MTWRFLTSGESHGRGLLLVVDGLPAGLAVRPEDLSEELARRRRGHGRGPRMALERDEIQVWGGLRHGHTTGAPVGMELPNAEAELWEQALDPWHTVPEAEEARRITAPRPGHADLPGAIKYRHHDLRNVLERASARTTAPRTVAGTLARCLLATCHIVIRGAVLSIGGHAVPGPVHDEAWERARHSPLGCATEEGERLLATRIDEARERGDSLGGVVVISAHGVPAGLGSGVEWDRRLDARLGGALLAIPGIKGVEIGEAFASAALPGSAVHDPIDGSRGEWRRETNHAGGLEGGMSNGEEIVLRLAMKPIPTLQRPLASFDVRTHRAVEAHAERSDVCAVPAACVVAEAMVAWVLGGELVEQFGGDTVEDLRERLDAYRHRAKGWLLR